MVGKKDDVIVEFAVKSAVPDIANFVVKVDHIVGDEVIENIFER